MLSKIKAYGTHIKCIQNILSSIINPLVCKKKKEKKKAAHESPYIYTSIIVIINN